MIEAQISMGQCPPTFCNAILDNLYGGNGEISALAQSNLNQSVGKKANFDAASSSLSFPGENASLKGIVIPFIIIRCSHQWDLATAALSLAYVSSS